MKTTVDIAEYKRLRAAKDRALRRLSELFPRDFESLVQAELGERVS